MRRDLRHNQSGNILWFILLAVALLAGLTIMLTRSGSSVDQTGDYEQLSIQATQLMRYASGIEQAIKRLQAINGCSENDISFDNTTETGYANANSPSDKSCHIFEPEGAGLEWRALTSQSLTMSGSDDMLFSSTVTINDVGEDNRTDLLILIPVAQTLCSHINDRRSISNTTANITSDINTLAKFTGTFSTTTHNIGDTAPEAPGMQGQLTGCIIDNNGEYVFYHTLIQR